MNVARSADLVRDIDRDMTERRDHLDAVDDSLRKVREITEAFEVSGGQLLAAFPEPA